MPTYGGRFRFGTVNQGRGQISYEDGSVYQGRWVENQRHGYGEHTDRNGTLYKGLWAHDQRSGIGEQTYLDGSKYVGDFANDERHGRGRMNYADGSEFNGEFASNQRIGQGYMTYADGSTYVGEFENDERHGPGSITYADNSLFYGAFVHDEMTGEGNFMHANGTWYQGAFLNGERHGFGRVILAGDDFTKAWRGFWDHNMLISLATKKFPDGGSYSGDILPIRFRDAGDIQNVQFHGDGAYKFPGARGRYIGSFELGKFSGLGMLFELPNGAVYSGQETFQDIMQQTIVMTVLAVFIGYLLYMWHMPNQAAPSPVSLVQPTIPMMMPFADVEIYVSSACSHCVAMKPEITKLMAQAQKEGISVRIITPEDSNAEAYMKSRNVLYFPAIFIRGKPFDTDRTAAGILKQFRAGAQA